MRILHYSLGFPPYRTGGLTKFCIDLMSQQISEGDDVALLWPGEILFSDKTKIRYRGTVSGVESHEIINPLPVPYDEGIKDIAAFIKPGDSECYDNFIKRWSPDVIHIHTLMGLHKEFISAAKSNGVKIVFTTHDFFPICPKVAMINNGELCSNVSDCSYCKECNSTALSVRKLAILQSGVYRLFKDFSLLKKMRKNHRDKYLRGGQNTRKLTMDMVDEEGVSEYKKLRAFYASIIEDVDMIHYNSQLTKRVYEQYFKIEKSRVLLISHAEIRDNRYIKIFSDSELRISYLGTYSKAKGFYMLKDALDKLWAERKNFVLNIFFTPEKAEPYMNISGRYNYADLRNIFDRTDVVVVPSIMYETFGYVVLEAMSYGIPVIVTKNVGAKDIIPDNGGIVLDETSSVALKQVIENLTDVQLIEMNKSIVDAQFIGTIADMSENIKRSCYR